ncbi:MAG: hypothetical protein K6D94_00855, partial [Clostridiales bacterium]|nr:hypothetical protein [Clostridiales bacterium]
EQVSFEFAFLNEPESAVRSVSWPLGFAFGAAEGEGYTVLSRMQGCIVPARFGRTINGGEWDGIIFERDSYMPVYGQCAGKSSYTFIYDTPWDALYHIKHEAGGDTLIRPKWLPELRTFGYRRRAIVVFSDDGSGYVGMMKSYRHYLRERGMLKTLEMKIAENPNVGYLLGAPVLHTGIAGHISEKSIYYNKDDLSKNDWAVPFSERSKSVRRLRSLGVDKIYMHLDGWGYHGYDNLHPDPFPVNEAAGGAAAMKELSDTCRELGYRFGIHDQYRDYYYDAPSFDIENACENEDGSRPYVSVWYGGEQTVLCQQLAPDYVRRNYDEFGKLGIQIDGSYLDVYSVVGLDRCFHKDHPMTRRESAERRRECFDILTARGIIPSSEETIDCIVPSIALCHHSPYFTETLGSPDSVCFGVAVPLFNLVWHDCMVIPWSAQTHKGDWGIPKADWGFLHALLNGGTCYISEDAGEKEIAQMKTVTRLQARVAKQEMISHEFIDGNIRRQRSVFKDGTAVEVDFDSDEWKIY